MTFVKKNTTPDKALPVGLIFGTRAVKGKVGIEIEVEGLNLPTYDDISGCPPWVYKEDHSLRGEENAEYVVKGALEFDKVPDALSKLWSVFDKKKSRLDESNRTSVHVHLNVQDFHLNRLTSLMAMYLAFEEVLVEWCGDHRVGNLFCLRGKDAPGIVSQVKDFLKTGGKAPLYDHLHYSAMNVHAMTKFGSLEFRTLRGTSDRQVIEDWVGVLQRLYEASGEFPDPREVCGLFSAQGPLQFFDTILGDKATVIRAGTGLGDDRIRESMYEGIRLAQDLCYCRDWDLFKGLDIKADPFGRDERKIAKRLTETPVVEEFEEFGIEFPPMPTNVASATAAIMQGLVGATTPPPVAPPGWSTMPNEWNN